MKLAKSALLLTSLISGATFLTACAYHDHPRSYGYYDYGYRDGYYPNTYYRDSYYPNRYAYYPGMTYDSRLGVYVVIGRPNHYFYHDRYYRYGGNRWYSSAHLDRGWREHGYRNLPPGLAKKYRDDRRRGRHG